MSFNIKEVAQHHLFIGKGFFDDIEAAPPIENIKTSIIDRLLFISYADYYETSSKIKKLDKSLILIFNSDTAEYQRQAYLPKMSIINIGVLEEKKLLIMMTRGENSIFIIDYMQCTGVAKLGDLPSSQMFVSPFSSAMVQAQMDMYKQAIDADALLYTSMDDGHI